MADKDRKKITPAKSAPLSPPGHESMLDEAMATNMVRNAYTRERAVFLMRTIIVSITLNAVLAMVIAFLAARPIPHLYFWTDGNGTIKPLVALGEPVLSESERTIWVTQAVVQAFTMDFANYRGQLQANRINFTPEGFEAFTKAIQESGIQSSIVNFKYLLSAVPTASPVQVAAGRLPSGVYAWQYEIPMLLTYQATDRNNTQAINLQVVVVRVPETQNPRGMAIARFQSKG